MLDIVRDLIASGMEEDLAGKKHPLHSATNAMQGEFLQKLIKQVDASTCLEIGLAYGISSLFICESLANQKSPRFISIDPFQTDWHDIGLLNLKRCGFDRFTEFHRDFSHAILPGLLAANVIIDFAYVDTSKVFDVVLLDACYLARLLRVGGVMVFDDCTSPGVGRVARYLARWPHLELIARHGEFLIGKKKKLVSRVARLSPRRERIFR